MIQESGSIQVGIQELRLRPGCELKLFDNKGNMLAHRAQFIAVFGGKSLLISMMVDSSRKIALREGDTYQVKGFTGIYDFSFNASVLQVDGAQFNARLSSPDSVTVKFVRSHLRVQVNLPSKGKLTNQDHPTALLVTDLSVGGVGVESASPLGNVGERITLELPMEFEKKKTSLNLTAEIRHVNQAGTGTRTGLEFIDASQHDKLMLHYLVSTLSDHGAVIEA